MSLSPFKNDILANKVVFITGGATGIGFGICKVLGSHGAKIGMMARRKNNLDEAVANLTKLGIDALGVVGDVRNSDLIKQAIQQVVEKYGSLDIVVNNAAGNFVCAAEELTPNGFKTVQEIDLQGTFNTCLAALPYLKREPGKGTSVIINITATLHYRAIPFQVHAASAKAGIDVVTQTLGVEWGHYGIRVVGIAPGPISGTVGGPTGRVFGDNISAGKYDAGPLGRFGEVEDIGNTALFLLSNAASYITATTVVVDGGHWHGTSGNYHKIKDMVSRKKDVEKQSRKPAAKL